MKIIYCILGVSNPGGMERVLLNKVKWICANTNHEVVVVTTDQRNLRPFYDFPTDVRFIDLNINYTDDNGKGIIGKSLGYLKKKHLHKSRLRTVLMQERPDVTISLFPCESSFIPDIKDGSKKVLEHHFNRFFRLQYGRTGLLGLIDRLRSICDVKLAKKFDSFVVLTEEDCGYWGALKNIRVIPNAAIPLTDTASDCTAKRVIAVGRLDYQKGFDRLLKIWAKVMRNKDFADWHLDIFGQGEWHDMLGEIINELGLSDSVTLNNPSKDIAQEYLNSSILAMTSHYEGLPMVMIEAMSSGLPVVSYDYKCGPKDIIHDGVNGFIIPDGDETAFAHALSRLMYDTNLRERLGHNAQSVTDTYSEDTVMGKWMELFNMLINDN